MTLLQKSLRIAARTGALRPSDFAPLLVDRTEQPKTLMGPIASVPLGWVAWQQTPWLHQFLLSESQVAGRRP